MKITDAGFNVTVPGLGRPRQMFPMLPAISAALLLAAVGTGFSDSQKTSGTLETAVQLIAGDTVGIASYYAHQYHGNFTASGEIFDMHQLTAAHRTLPFGSLVRVTRLDNGRFVEVKINDRGPFVNGRIIDVSLAAARELEMVAKGIVRVKLELVKPAPKTVASDSQNGIRLAETPVRALSRSE